ncbi:unnamed protein product, partial [Phaeothamnion confervicola]
MAVVVVPGALFLLFRMSVLTAAAIGLACELAMRAHNRCRMRRALTVESSDRHDCLAHFCCSSCAVAQEAREVARRGYPAVDFCTGELPQQERNRLLTTDDRFLSHLAAISLLSKLLLAVGGCLLLAALVHTGAVGAALVLSLLTQPALILYAAYWRRHRSALLLDTVVKLLATGFCVVPLTAVVAKMVSVLVLFAALAVAESAAGVARLPNRGCDLADVSILNAFLPEPPTQAVLHQRESWVIAVILLVAAATAASEEVAKLLAARYCGACRAPTLPAVVISCVAIGLGYTAFDGIVVVWGTARWDLFAVATPSQARLAALAIRLLLPVDAVCALLQGIYVWCCDHLWRVPPWPRAAVPAALLNAACRFVFMASHAHRIAAGKRVDWGVAKVALATEVVLLAAGLFYAHRLLQRLRTSPSALQRGAHERSGQLGHEVAVCEGWGR